MISGMKDQSTHIVQHYGYNETPKLSMLHPIILHLFYTTIGCTGCTDGCTHNHVHPSAPMGVRKTPVYTPRWAYSVGRLEPIKRRRLFSVWFDSRLEYAHDYFRYCVKILGDSWPRPHDLDRSYSAAG